MQTSPIKDKRKKKTKSIANTDVYKHTDKCFCVSANLNALKRTASKIIKTQTLKQILLLLLQLFGLNLF